MSWTDLMDWKMRSLPFFKLFFCRSLKKSFEQTQNNISIYYVFFLTVIDPSQRFVTSAFPSVRIEQQSFLKVHFAIGSCCCLLARVSPLLPLFYVDALVPFPITCNDALRERRHWSWVEVGEQTLRHGQWHTESCYLYSFCPAPGVRLFLSSSSTAHVGQLLQSCIPSQQPLFELSDGDSRGLVHQPAVNSIRFPE